MIPNLKELAKGKKECRAQVKKFRLLVDYFKPKLEVKFSGRTVRVLEDNNINSYFVTRMFWDYDYQTMNIRTNTTSKHFLQKLNREGMVYII